MKKVNLTIVGILTVCVLSGCSSKNTPPTEVKTWDKGASLSLNSSLIIEQKREVPKDDFLLSNDWTYQIFATKKGSELLSNEQIVKTFYIAHHAQDIILVGRSSLIKEYKTYFEQNDVKANIILQPVPPIENDLNSVNMMFFNKKKIK